MIKLQFTRFYEQMLLSCCFEVVFESSCHYLWENWKLLDKILKNIQIINGFKFLTNFWYLMILRQPCLPNLSVGANLDVINAWIIMKTCFFWLSKQNSFKTKFIQKSVWLKKFRSLCCFYSQILFFGAN